MHDVSFCVPAYNAEASIGSCLQAILAEPATNREILVVDNCSTDRTVPVARKLLADVSGARIITNERNLGRVENWNKCLELATGRYLRFVTTNNRILPGSTKALREQLRENPHATMAYGRTRLPTGISSQLSPVIFTSTEALWHFSRVGCEPRTLDSILFDSDALRKYGFRFPVTLPYWADFWFILHVAGTGRVVRIDSETVFFDSAVKTRFANAGLRSEGYYMEARQCALLLKEMLDERCGNGTEAFEFLYHHWANHYGGELRSPFRSYRLFKDSGRCPLHYLIRRWRGELRMKTQHYLIRAAVKCGLYRLPEETKA